MQCQPNQQKGVNLAKKNVEIAIPSIYYVYKFLLLSWSCKVAQPNTNTKLITTQMKGASFIRALMNGRYLKDLPYLRLNWSFSMQLGGCVFGVGIKLSFLNKGYVTPILD